MVVHFPLIGKTQMVFVKQAVFSWIQLESIVIGYLIKVSNLVAAIKELRTFLLNMICTTPKLRVEQRLAPRTWRSITISESINKLC